MKGAIIGDIVGSIYEGHNIFTKNFPLFSSECCFTDDTVLTCAVAKALTEQESNVTDIFRELGKQYLNAGYGPKFIHWLLCNDPRPYYSCGNGSAMRVSPVGFIAESKEEVKELSKKVTEVTHNHPEGLKGAECVAMCIYLAKHGFDKNDIVNAVETEYYILDPSCADYRLEELTRGSKIICQQTVPRALECFLESTDFEDCIRNAISIGGDSDTIAAIAGSIAEAYYGVPDELWNIAKGYLTPDLLEIVDKFYTTIES